MAPAVAVDEANLVAVADDLHERAPEGGVGGVAGAEVDGPAEFLAGEGVPLVAGVGDEEADGAAPAVLGLHVDAGDGADALDRVVAALAVFLEALSEDGLVDDDRAPAEAGGGAAGGVDVLVGQGRDVALAERVGGGLADAAAAAREVGLEDAGVAVGVG